MSSFQENTVDYLKKRKDRQLKRKELAKIGSPVFTQRHRWRYPKAEAKTGLPKRLPGTEGKQWDLQNRLPGMRSGLRRTSRRGIIKVGQLWNHGSGAINKRDWRLCWPLPVMVAVMRSTIDTEPFLKMHRSAAWRKCRFQSLCHFSRWLRINPILPFVCNLWYTPTI